MPRWCRRCPDKVTAAPAGSSGNFALGGHDPARGRDYVMYQISGGGYGGNADHDGLSNGCSTIGISKSPPVEVMEQAYPVLYRHYALREGSGGAGRQRGGFGLPTRSRSARRGARVIRHGPRPVRPARRARWRRRHGQRGHGVARRRRPMSPPHLSKEQDIQLAAGDRVRVARQAAAAMATRWTRDPRTCARRCPRWATIPRKRLRSASGWSSATAPSTTKPPEAARPALNRVNVASVPS